MNKYNEVEIQTAKNLLEKGFKWITRGIYGAILAYKIKPDQEKYGYGNVICSDRVPIFESIRCGDEPVSLESIVYPQILDDDEKMNDDLISRQAAIDETWKEPTYTDPLNVLTEVRDRIKALPSAQPEQRWIPCSERLPDRDGKYLVVGRQKAINILKFDGGRWYGKWGVIAWLPLPEPYREGEPMSDSISRQAAIDELDKGAWGAEWDKALAQAMLESLPSAQPEEDCGTCKHGIFGSTQCDNCRVRYPSHYERRTDDGE